MAIDESKINFQYSGDVDPLQAPPMVKQYLEIKKKHPDKLLLYRVGDFYETFFEDARELSKAIDITLTTKEGGNYVGRFHLAGIPIKAFDSYIPKLLEQNYKIAVCEQLEEASATKSIVKRGITEIITAGTITSLNLINSDTNNWLAAIIQEKNTFGMAYCDITTGEFYVTEGSLSDILSELSRIKPSEIIAPLQKQKLLPFQIVPDEKADLPECILKAYNCTKVSKTAFSQELAEKNIKKAFNVETLDAFGFKDLKIGFLSVGAIISYLKETRCDNLPKFDVIKPYKIADYMMMDMNTAKNLELVSTSRSKYGSLLWAIDRAKTNMGQRLLKKWITQPLINKEEIQKRYDAVEILMNNSHYANNLQTLFQKIYDIERLSVKITNSTANPRDYISIKDSLLTLPEINEIIENLDCEYLKFETDIDELVDFATIIDRTIKPDAPLTIKDGGIIKEGVNSELDYYYKLLNNAEEELEEIERTEKDRTGIKNLKVGYSKNFGYFIEITNSYLNQVPPDYVRRQTLTGCERFITERLKKFETEVSAAKYKSTETEYKIFSDLREYSKEFADKIKEIAHNIAKIDVMLSFAAVAKENNYVKPVLSDKNILVLKNSRHPVIEKILPMGQYVPNDLTLISKDINENYADFMILTGPNMAGKSTYMRQSALIVIMAQMGCFVPCDYAEIGIADKIFTRVGAQDDLSLGQSTFMVEMSETAYILNSATPKSLILLDEIGRGTSTYDGVAIAWSVAEYIATEIKARTIFATHYHELNVLPKQFPQIKNYRITVSEADGEIKFLRKVVEGSASRSYGIEVAKMAGVPETVIKNAQKMMTKLQKNFSKDLSSKTQNQNIPQIPQLTLFE